MDTIKKFQSKEFRIERESLQALAGADVSRDTPAESVMESLKGKEVKAVVFDDRFEMLRVKGVISEDKDKVTGAIRLWVENWQGTRLPKRWAIKVIDIQRG